MKALVYKGPKQLVYTDVSEPTLKVGEALIDAVSGKHTFNEWAGVRSSTGDMTSKANLKSWM